MTDDAPIPTYDPVIASLAAGRAATVAAIDHAKPSRAVLRDELRAAAEDAAPPDPKETDHAADDRRADQGAGRGGRDATREPAPDPSGGGGGRRDSRPKGDIWDGCPVRPLGTFDDVCFYLNRLGELRTIDNHSLDKIRHLFLGDTRLLARHFPQFDKDGVPRPGKFDQAQAAAAMVAACGEHGVWRPTGRMRGPGCWTDDDGGLIIHAGDAVLVGGEWVDPGVHGGKVYAAAAPGPRPAKAGARGDAAQALLDLIGTWSWRRPDIDPVLALGLIVAQMVGGALEWRPVGWLTGDAATGKSTFQALLLHVHGGEGGLLQAADATEAGIRSVVGFSSLPVAIDELEPDVDRPQKVKSVVELARRAASGAQIFRGSSDQKGYQSNAYSCFLFSSILIPPMEAQDRSRMIILDLHRLPPDAPKRKNDPRRLRQIGQQLRRLIVDGWDTWGDRLELWRAALADHGQTGRARDKFGTVLALADMMLHPGLPSAEVMDGWARKLGRAVTEETQEVGSNAEDMIMTLMGQSYDVYRRGEQHTVAQWVMAAAQMRGAPRDLYNPHDGVGAAEDKARDANEKLAKIGLRVRGSGDKAALFLPNSRLPGLCALFEGTQWADGVWSQAARRLPGAEPVPNPLRLAGISTRGVYVPFAAIAGLSDFQTAAPAPASTVAPHIDDAAEDYF